MSTMLFQSPHRRYNPLLGEWVLVSPHRAQRPWQGQQERTEVEQRPAYDPKCYLCPGNIRVGGVVNPNYTETFVFTNDFAALLPDTIGAEPEGNASTSTLFRAEPVAGLCRVICFSPRHDLTLAEMTTSEIHSVLDVWTEQIQELRQSYRWVQVFENKGAAMGCSNPHPHGQIWASNFLPLLPAREDTAQRRYFEEHDTSLLAAYAQEELTRGERVIEANEHWVLLVPFWAVWPFEMLLVPRRPVGHLPELTEEERGALAEILRMGLVRYDNLFQTSFPYSMGWHGAPGEGDAEHWQLHAHFYPPLLRSATVRKFMVGYEMLAEPQRDLTAEQAAARLRELSTQHYRLSSV
jgi:UDPglucose--hexose-1-phosphate uridylyltransferase